MFWYIILVFAIFSAVFLYRLRFKQYRHIASLDFVQFCYLFIITPMVFLSLINIGLDITNRPEKIFLAIPTNLLFCFYSISICIGAMGVAIHSTATTIHDHFPENEASITKDINEVFHGPLSHGMLFLSGMAVMVFAALLELNHPDIKAFHSDLFLIIGCILGILGVIAIAWSTYVKTNLIAAMLSAVIVFWAAYPLLGNLFYYPMVVLALSCLSVLAGGLLVVLIIYKSSNFLTRLLIQLLFPDGHPHHG